MKFGSIILTVVALSGCSDIAGTDDTETALCGTAGLSASAPSGTAGTVVTFTATAGCDVGDTPEYRFYRRGTMGNWNSVQGPGASNVYTMNTTGMMAGTYQLQAWVRAQGSTAAFESVGYAQFTITSASTPCTNAKVAMQNASGLHGFTQTLTASASSCANPQYAFFTLAAGSSTWVLAQDFSSTATFSFTDPVGGAEGDYQIQAWTKDASSVDPYDSVAATTYTSGFARATQSHVTLADGSEVDTGFTGGKICPNGLVISSASMLAICTQDQGVWGGGLIANTGSIATQARLRAPNYAKNNGQIPYDPNAITSQVGQLLITHPTGIADAGNGGIAIWSSDIGAENYSRGAQFSNLRGPFMYPGSNVTYRKDSLAAGTQIFPIALTAVLPGAGANNYAATFDASGNTIVGHGGVIVSSIVYVPIGAGVTAPVTSIVRSRPGDGSSFGHDIYLAVNANGVAGKGGGIYWPCTGTGTSFAEIDTGISASDKLLVNRIAAIPNAVGSTRPARTCGTVTGITDYASVILAGLQGGSSMYKSIDGGATWSASNTGLPVGVSINALSVLWFDAPNTVFAATSAGLYRSTDTGTTWNLVGLGGKNVVAVATTVENGSGYPSRVFAATDEVNGLYQTFAPNGESDYRADPATPVPCGSTPTMTYTKASPQTAGNFSLITGGATGCAAPYYQFWMLPPGGSWQLGQKYSPRNQFDFITTGASTPGTYSFQMWVRDASSPAAYDAVTSFTFAIQGTGAACTGGGLTASLPSGQPINTPVTLTATSSTCGAPQYTFFELPPGGSWTQVQSGTSPTFDFTSSTAGDYSFQVWVRDAGSVASFDTVGQLGFTLAP